MFNTYFVHAQYIIGFKDGVFKSASKITLLEYIFLHNLVGSINDTYIHNNNLTNYV